MTVKWKQFSKTLCFVYLCIDQLLIERKPFKSRVKAFKCSLNAVTTDSCFGLVLRIS